VIADRSSDDVRQRRVREQIQRRGDTVSFLLLTAPKCRQILNVVVRTIGMDGCDTVGAVRASNRRFAMRICGLGSRLSAISDHPSSPHSLAQRKSRAAIYFEDDLEVPRQHASSHANGHFSNASGSSVIVSCIRNSLGDGAMLLPNPDASSRGEPHQLRKGQVGCVS